MRRIASILIVLLFVAGAPAASASGNHAQATGPTYDIIIKGGHIIDGTGSPWFSGSIAIKNGRIAAIGRLPGATAKRIIEAKGMIVAPGFIDMLGQSDLSVFVDPEQQSKIFQGITTEITGEGESPAPQNARMIEMRRSKCALYEITCGWHTYPQYFSRIRKKGTAINMGFYVGATSVREMVLGYGDVTPTPSQLNRMKGIVAAAMRAGAFGVSTALQYPPAPYAKTSEIVALARSAAKFGGIYATHMRSEGAREMAALNEAIDIGRKAKIPVEIFHLKVGTKSHWGTARALIARINKARAAGLDITADTYAYTAWHNDLATFTPPWANAGGIPMLIQRLKDPQTRAKIREDILSPKRKWNDDWKEIEGDTHDILIVSVGDSRSLGKYVGERMSEVAKQWHENPLDTILDFLIKDHGETGVAVFGMSQPDVSMILKQPWVSICTDDQGTSPTGLMRKIEPFPHPRAYGTFARIVRKYVRQLHLLTLPDAIRKMTALPAQRMGLTQRGVLKKGMIADVVVFDPLKFGDRATYTHPSRLSVGMDDVVVNGVPVIFHGKMTGALPGKVLLGPGAAEAR